MLYFNNASLGPSPALVADATESYRRTLDAFPSRWMWGGWKDEYEAVRTKSAELLGASPEEIALIHNTTEGMNLVAFSLDLRSGDEVIVADHEHYSGTIPWEYWQVPKGVRLVRPTLPLVPTAPEELVDVYRRAITPRTRVISMCHVVNTNGMILPVKEVSALARERGILVAVDGAQAPGHIDVDLHDLGCDFYAASAHKWLFSPKGVGIFFARQELPAPAAPAYRRPRMGRRVDPPARELQHPQSARGPRPRGGFRFPATHGTPAAIGPHPDAQTLPVRQPRRRPRN